MSPLITFSSFLLSLALGGCGSRPVPSEFPAGSAASLETPPGPLVEPVELSHSGHDHAEHDHAAHDHEGHEPAAHGSPDGHAGHDHAGHDHHDHSGHDHSQHESGDQEPGLYACPMHPDVTSKEPGQCPKCGMTLEKP